MSDTALAVAVAALVLLPHLALLVIAFVQIARFAFDEWWFGPAWVAAVLLVPFAGSAVWFLFGERLSRAVSEARFDLR